MCICLIATGLLAGCGSGSSEEAATAPVSNVGAPPAPPPAPPPPGAGSVTLSWYPPTHYMDGAPLAVKGYRFYAGPTRRNLSLVEDLRQPGLTSYMISGLSSGQWFFAVTAYDDQGVESPFSNIASKRI